MREHSPSFYEKYVKRLLDIILSLVAIIILSPVLVVVAIIVRIKLGSPVIFKQMRPGKDEKIFAMYKFRSMTDGRDQEGNLLPDGMRMPPFGRKLRSTSLDELPELFNILKGDMSIVGPRPQLVRDMVFMSEEQRTRHTVRQGLTGLAQVNGRNAITWEAKLAYDIDYIEHITFLGDLKIIGKTVGKVLGKADISEEGMETAEDYGDYLLRIGSVSMEEFVVKKKTAEEILEYNC